METQSEIFRESSKGGRNKSRREEASAAADDDDDDVQFQKLEFNIGKAGKRVAGEGEKDGSAQRKKTKQALLKQALKKKEMAAGDANNDAAWGDAFDRAEGKKVFDDPKKLAKVRCF